MDKRTKIITSAMELFAEHGFHETSMQTVANYSNISKGNIYTYFKSKEDLLYHIFKYFGDLMKDSIEEAVDSTLPPKERFITQMEVTLRQRLQFKGFFMMQYREQTMNLSPEIKQIMLGLQEYKFNWLKQNLLEIYGENILPYVFDASLILDSMVNGYVKVLTVMDHHLSLNGLCSYMFDRFDAMMKELLETKPDALFPENYAKEILTTVAARSSYKDVFDLFKEMKKAILNQASIKDQERTDIIKSIEFMVSELKQEEPRLFILKGVLNELSSIESIKGYVKELKELLSK
ncbi:TetR/AcrR family transcriptional regulator [Falsibacillus albus]|uniref:TetR/AcrR family transcriptional regulator n=1 Tax=Falsibacillus albus TaxID=2478915 RepID=A0A3L7JIS5_9BACI|nr:TetR/AcrR family transcriptional regulator [Falsibacillus albus]RLQ90626.1 TetR/AcrR family transcriptional regulator [Falsibacillus albus]